MAAPCPIAESTVSLALTGLLRAYHAKLFSVSRPSLLCMLWFLLALLLSGASVVSALKRHDLQLYDAACYLRQLCTLPPALYSTRLLQKTATQQSNQM